MISSPFDAHRKATKKLAKSLKWTDVYHWLVEHGYFPESYVLPPCFKVTRRLARPQLFSKVKGKKKLSPALTPRMCCDIHFPKTDLTDRTFGIIHPELHNDIAYHIGRNWRAIVDCLIPNNSAVTCYSFPVPIDSAHPGRVGHVRSGRMIYEFIWMTEEDLTSAAYRYTHILRADIRNFYPSIYTHSISWAIHGKKLIRKANNRYDLTFLGNRLDRLFQYANDQKTNGIPIGPVVSDIVAEVIAAGVDRELTKAIRNEPIECEMTRFKDDYRILVKSDADGRRVVKLLQAALKHYDLELADDKTVLHELPGGLFRPWVSAYHAVHPIKRVRFRWKEFRELYLAVLRIDEQYPGTGVIDRFLADIVSRKGNIKVGVTVRNLQKAMSMLLMLGNRRLKSFPKILAIIESILRSPFGQAHSAEITSYLDTYLRRLSDDEPRNTYLISWIAYFLVSNNLKSSLTFAPRYRNPMTRSVFNNRGAVFQDATDFKLFEGCRAAGRTRSMLSYLDVFTPPRPT
jgi:hypothetical protein